MKVIVLSNEGEESNEQDRLNEMFEAGLTNFHLNKPGYSIKQIEDYLKGIPEQFRKYIVVHGYDKKQLVKSYGLKGLHIDSEERRKQYWTGTRATLLKVAKSGIKLSTSFNSLNTIRKAASYYDYILLNNIFKSRSKKLFKSHYDWTEIEETLKILNDKRVMAMGGISEKKLPSLKNLGFSGAVLKSAVWNDPDPVDAFKRLMESAKYAKRQSFYNYNY